jgi:hypothetical protein
MLRSMQELEKFAISASDGVIGRVKDCYFDDDAWTVRYLVVDTGSWLSSRKVLISPISVSHPNWVGETLQVGITRKQLRDSPNIDTDKPVSRQYEQQYLGYYGYPYYWGGAGLWGAGIYPYAMAPGYAGYGPEGVAREREEQVWLLAEQARHRNDDPHLRSCKEVNGYHVHAVDGEIGHVAGYLIDDQTWAVRYIIVDTSNWWVGHKVLIAHEWIREVEWAGRTVSIDLTRQAVRDAPHYDPAIPWSSRMDLSLYQHYGRTGYFAGRTETETQD